MSKKEPSKLIAPLQRIIIGDVGSGKTIVAFIIACMFLQGVKDKSQVALLAPTEVLAYQHYQKLCEFLKPLQLEITPIFVTSKLILIWDEKITKGKFEAAVNLVDTSIFWLGTHALLHNDLVRPDLVMVDEQHRFGVMQRKNLASHDEELTPHFLSFTATPIPRTLALTLYKNLQPHFLDTLQSRHPINTSITSFTSLDGLIKQKIAYHLDKGGKVYIICTKIESGEEDEELLSVGRAYTYINNLFPGQVMQVHGKMVGKKDILTEFKESTEKHILIATTVIEVGVDVSAATMVVILNAERFGLAALHQIRGRVGRNTFDYNECLLVAHDQYKWSKRLKYLCEFQSGFELAQKDLELRGGGNMFGVEQSGFDDEINQLLGLDPDLYVQINQLSEQANVEQLPRLKKYVEKEASKMWSE